MWSPGRLYPRAALAALILGMVVPPAGEAQNRSVVINQVRLSDDTVVQLEQRYRVPIRNGTYWYDKRSGAWGISGGPTLGFITPNLDVGGPLRADASNGHTGVFINGRELHRVDVVGLLQLGPVYQGRYWMDGAGNIGVENGPMLLNLWQVVRVTNRGSGGAYSSYTRSGSLFGSDGKGCLVFNDPGSGTSATSSGC
ncbi:MAG: hypothetical protein ABI836_00200 [Gemmatimonadota bacterium]